MSQSQYRYGTSSSVTPLKVRAMQRRTSNSSNVSVTGTRKWSASYTSDTPYSTDGTTFEGDTLYKIEHPHGVGTTRYCVSVINEDNGKNFSYYDELYEFDTHTIWFTQTDVNITITVVG